MHVNATEPLNEYAVVCYVPEPLGPYLDSVRRELAPWMPPGRSHVTVLQPRPLQSDVTEVRKTLHESVSTLRAFEIAPSSVGIFETTGVVYLGVERGVSELERIHQTLNSNGASYPEPFPFHPHITLAQGVKKGDQEAVLERAKALWAEYTGERTFAVDTFYFVQNTVVDLWIDLEAIRLAPRV